MEPCAGTDVPAPAAIPAGTPKGMRDCGYTTSSQCSARLRYALRMKRSASEGLSIWQPHQLDHAHVRSRARAPWQWPVEPGELPKSPTHRHFLCAAASTHAGKAGPISSMPQGLLIAAKPEKTALRHSGIELALNNR
jgi:hypothetical protein